MEEEEGERGVAELVDLLLHLGIDVLAEYVSILHDDPDGVRGAERVDAQGAEQRVVDELEGGAGVAGEY